MWVTDLIGHCWNQLWHTFSLFIPPTLPLSQAMWQMCLLLCPQKYQKWLSHLLALPAPRTYAWDTRGPVNKPLCSSAPFSSNIELCVCVYVCVCVCVVCRSLLTDTYICRQDNHTIIKQGVLFWYLFYFENWPDSLCLFSVWLPVKYDLIWSALFSFKKLLAAHGKMGQMPKQALQSALRRRAPRRCSGQSDWIKWAPKGNWLHSVAIRSATASSVF